MADSTNFTTKDLTFRVVDTLNSASPQVQFSINSAGDATLGGGASGGSSVISVGTSGVALKLYTAPVSTPGADPALTSFNRRVKITINGVDLYIPAGTSAWG